MALVVILAVTFALAGSAQAQIYEEGTYGSGEYSTSASADDEPVDGDGDGDSDPAPSDSNGEPLSQPGVGTDDDRPTPGTPSTEARDKAGSLHFGPVIIDWSSLWIGVVVILGVTLLLGAWMLRGRRH